MLRWFASNQIRNVACVAGNIATASPISDLNPMLVGLDATITLASASEGKRRYTVMAKWGADSRHGRVY